MPSYTPLIRARVGRHATEYQGLTSFRTEWDLGLHWLNSCAPEANSPLDHNTDVYFGQVYDGIWHLRLGSPVPEIPVLLRNSLLQWSRYCLVTMEIPLIYKERSWLSKSDLFLYPAAASPKADIKFPILECTLPFRKCWLCPTSEWI